MSDQTSDQTSDQGDERTRESREPRTRPAQRIKQVAAAARERAADAVSTARTRAADAVADAVGAARGKVGDAQAIVADQLEAGAQAVRGERTRGTRGGAARDDSRAAALRSRLGDTMETAAYGLRRYDVTELGDLITRQTRARPWPALLTAFALGSITTILLSRALGGEED